MPYVVQPQSVSPPTLRRLPPLSPVLPSAPTMSPLQTETVSGQTTGHRSPLSPRDLPVVKITSSLSIRPHVRERSVADDALLVPRRPELPPPELLSKSLPRLEQSGRKMPPKWFEMVYLWYSPSTSCVDDPTVPSPRSVEVLKVRPADPNY